jgi:hypothetical protein
MDGKTNAYFFHIPRMRTAKLSSLKAAQFK